MSTCRAFKTWGTSFNEAITYGGLAGRRKLFGRIKSRLNKLFSIIWRDYLFKIITWTVIITFLTTTLYQDLALNQLGSGQAWAIEEPLLIPSSEGNPLGPAKFNLGEFVLPTQLGHAENLAIGASGKTIIHIQDAHCNYAAQLAIYNLVEYLNKVYNVKLINLEGGIGEYDLAVFTDILDPGIRKEVADYFLREGRINGPEFFALNNPDLVTLWGIDQKTGYFTNLDAYRSFIPSKNTVDRNLNALKNLFSKLKQKIYSKELLYFDKRCMEFEENKSDFKGYIAYLTELTKAKDIYAEDLKNIGFLTKVLSLEEGIDFKEAEKERSALIDELEKRLSKVEREELVLKAVQFKATTLSQKDFYSYLKQKADEARIDIRNYTNLSRYIGYIYLYGSIDNKDLFEEIAILKERIEQKLFQNALQRELALYSKCFNVFDKLLNIKARRWDYDFYNEKAKKMDITEVIGYVQTQCERLEIDYYFDKDVFALKQALSYIASFYAYANKRDEGFINNTLSRMMELSEDASIVVTGGFHTESLKELFKEQGASYVSIIPNFKENHLPNKYFERLAGKLSPIEEYFLALRRKHGPDIEVVTMKPAQREQSAMMNQTVGSGMQTPLETWAAEQAVRALEIGNETGIKINGKSPKRIDVEGIKEGKEPSEEKPEDVGKGAINIARRIVSKFVKAKPGETEKERMTRIEDSIVPWVESGIKYLIASGVIGLLAFLGIAGIASLAGTLATLGGIFVLIHAIQKFKPAEGLPSLDKLDKKTRMPAIIALTPLVVTAAVGVALFPLTPTAVAVFAVLSASGIAELAVHITLNRYVTEHPLSGVQKGMLGKSNKAIPDDELVQLAKTAFEEVKVQEDMDEMGINPGGASSLIQEDTEGISQLPQEAPGLGTPAGFGIEMTGEAYTSEDISSHLVRKIHTKEAMEDYYEGIEKAVSGFMRAVKRPDRPYVIFLTEDEFELISQYFGIMKKAEKTLRRKYEFDNLTFYIVKDEKELRERYENAVKIFEDPKARGIALLGGLLYKKATSGEGIYKKFQEDERFIIINTVYPENGFYYVTGLLAVAIGILDYKFNGADALQKQRLINLLAAVTGTSYITAGNLDALLKGVLPLVLPEVDRDQAWFELKTWLDRDTKLGRSL